jgi:hypothetical protein
MQFANQTLYDSEHALIFNRHGERFIDETLGDHLTAMAAVEQPDARVLVVADQRVLDEWMLGVYVEGITPVDRFELCCRRGWRPPAGRRRDRRRRGRPHTRAGRW